MKRLCNLLMMICCATLLSACGGVARKVGPVELLSFRMVGLSGAEVTVAAANRSGHTLRIREAELRLYYEQNPVGTAELRSEIVLHRRSTDTCATRWRLGIENPVLLLLVQPRLTAQRWEGLSVDYRMRVASGGVSKTFSEKMVPLSEFLATFAGTTSEPL